MFVDEIFLTDFRNYEKGHLTLSKGVNIIYGPNAMGKTNILEAIFLMCYARSHRLAQEHEMIRHDNKIAKVLINFNSHNRDYQGEIKLSIHKKKQIKINRIPIKKTSELMGYLNVVMFCPDDLRIIKGAPRERRRMMDYGICQISKKYFYSLSQYTKIVQQRNKLLKEKPNTDSLWVWDEKMQKYGSEIILMRNAFIDLMQRYAMPVQKEISGESIELVYKNGADIKDFSSIEAINEQFNNTLRKNREREKAFGTSLTGPHRDDFEIYINSKEAKVYGSQGQQRTAVLALKMGEVSIIKEKTGQTPIVLLDDVFSELDEKRQSYLLENTKQMQVIITCTSVPNYANVKKINVQDVKK